MRKIWIMAGEASGDLYGAKLGEELSKIALANNTKLKLSGMGGPRMIQSGIPVLVDSTELGVMGVVEVLKLLFTFIGIYFKLARAARNERPDTVVLIDYPGFNLLFALAMKFSKIPVVWYVCPHLWVWGKWRLPVLSRICTRMLVIFPFEVEVFAPTMLKAEFVGHPLYDIVMERKNKFTSARQMDTLLLLPGSRTMEIERLLQPMLQTVTELHIRRPELKFHLSAPRERIYNLCMEMISDFRKKEPNLPEIELSFGDTGQWLFKAGTGIAASGTVTVECALSGLPLVVGYKLNPVTLFLASLVVKLYRGFFTMTNIIANRRVYEELLQWHFAPEEIIPGIEAILPGGNRRKDVENGMSEVADLLKPQSASAARSAAIAVWECCNKNL